MSPRSRRLISDLRLMEELAARGQVSFRTEGSPPETYYLMLNATGLAVDDGRLVTRDVHRSARPTFIATTPTGPRSSSG